MKNRQCPGCKIEFPYQEELSALQQTSFARYGIASPECIAVFYDILAKEQAWFGYPPAHRLLVDAYAVQHPPHLEHQQSLSIDQRLIDASIQSIPRHLIALYCAIEKGIELPKIAKILDHIVSSINQKQKSLEELSPPNDLGAIKVTNIQKALHNQVSLDDYTQLMWDWARSAWNAWNKHHNTIGQWYESYRQ